MVFTLGIEEISEFFSQLVSLYQKEINMLDLNASDRQMALNEVKVLAKMDHPNIVAYHDSFEKGTIHTWLRPDILES